MAWNDARFPAALTTLTDLPPVLWDRDICLPQSSPAVAIVGSRAASAVAIETASRLAADVGAAGITVVSGLARGVDSAAHRAALRTGRTIAVLGSGLDCGLSGRACGAREGDCERWRWLSASFRPARRRSASLSDAQPFDQRAFAWGRGNRGF